MNKKGKAKPSSLNDGTERKHAEEKFLDLYDNAPDMFASIDAKTAKVIECNQTLANVLGYSKKEIIGRSVFDLYPPEDIKYIKKNVFKRFVDMGEVRDAELQLLRKDDSRIDVSLNVSAVRDEQGNISHSRSVWRDITKLKEAGRELEKYRLYLEELVAERTLKLDKEIAEREKVDEALHTAAEDWELMFNTMSDGVSIHDSDMNIVLANKALGKLLRSSPEKLIGKKCYHVFHDCSEPIQDCPMGRCMLSKSPEYIEFFEPTINSWLSISITPFSNDRDDVVEFVHVARDITERKIIEDALKESESKFRTLATMSPSAIYLTDKDGKCVYANKKWREMTGQTLKEALGDGWKAGLHPNDRRKVFSDWGKTVQSKGTWGTEYRLQDKKGNVTWVYGTAAPITGENGNILGYVGNNSDITERKEIEDALRTSESSLSKAQEIALLGNWEWDIIQNKTVWSDNLYKIFGATPEQLNPDAYDEFIKCLHPEDRENVEKVMGNTLKTKTPFKVDYRIVCPDGTLRNIHAKGEVILDKKGKPIKMVGVSQDITELKKAEKELKRSRDHLEKLHNTLGDPVFSVKLPERMIDHATSSVEAVFGYTPEEFVGKSMEMLYSERKYYLAFGRELKSALEQNEDILHTEQVMKRKNGEAFPAEMTVAFLREDGKVTRGIGIVRDITERKRAEEELEKSRDYLEKLHNTLGDPVFSVKLPERIIDHANSSVEAVFGYKPEECIGKSTEIFYSERKDYLAFGRKLEKALEQNEDILHTEQVMKRKNGEAFPAEITLTFLRENGRAAQVITIVRDITVRKRAEEELLKLNEHLEERVEERTHELALASEELIRKEKLATLGQLSGSIAHEIRNPLGVIGNSVYYLGMKLKDADEKVKRHLDILQSEVLRTNVIISDLLDFSRGKSPTLVKGNLDSIIKDALKEAGLPDFIKVETRLDSDLPWIIIDQDQIMQVFLNLFSNAAHAMPEGGTLKITTGTEKGFVKVEVRDTGEGIPKENFEKIFEPLFTTKAKGTGLGLAIADGIVEKHKGGIEVKSKAGEGATFTVRLPVTIDGAS